MNKIYSKNWFIRKNAFGGFSGGFTLIELLVVVLIIGILSAVALPQYQKGLEKSRAAEVLIVADAVEKAERIYYLTNGEYTADLNALDITIPEKRGLSLRVYVPDGKNVSGWMVQISYYGSHITYQRYFDLPFDQCVAYSELQDWLCKDLGGVFVAEQASHRIYRIAK